MCALYENEAMQANGYNLGPKRLISQVQFISERISALALKRHVRKDAVSLCDCIVTLPRSFDDNREREFFKTAYTCGLSFHSDGRPLFVRRARAPMIRSPRSLIYN